MNYKLTCKKEASSLYYLSGSIIYSDSERTNTFINDVSIGKYLSILKLTEFRNELFYFEENTLFKIEDYKLNTFLKIENNVDKVILMNNQTYLCYQKISRREYSLGFYKGKVLEWNIITCNSYKTINDKYFIVSEKFDETKFSIHNLKNEKLWQYTLPEGFKIFGSVQAIDDVLFFIAYKDNHYQLVTGLDIETGTILYQNQYEVTNERKFISAHAYNPVDKLYYGLGDVYQIFNPKTGEIVLEKAVNECDSKVIRPYVNSVYDNKLWFISGKYEDVRFGCLDLDTQEVEFIQDFPQENDEMFEAPVFHEGKLYLKGKHYNNLYVLE